MKAVLANAYDKLMDRPGAGPVLVALARADTVVALSNLLPTATALGGPASIGQLRDLLMSLQPLLLRVNPGTDAEMVGLRHRSIAAHVLARHLVHLDPADLWLLLDNELGQAKRAELEEQLEECPRCLALLTNQQKLKSIVARCAGGDRAPDGLRERIVNALRHPEPDRDPVDRPASPARQREE